MSQDQELNGLQSRLANNLEWQEIKKGVIKETEQELITLENEQEEIEARMLELQGIPEKTQDIDALFDSVFTGMLQDVNVEVDKNEQGETIQ